MSMHINFKIGRDEYRAVPLEHIAYIEGHRRECTVHQWRGCGKPPLRISMCLSAIEPQLHQYHFVRCHRNFIVHPAALQWFGDKEIALPQGKPIPVSDMRLRRLPNGAPLPESYLYACILYGICLVGTHGGPLYVSNTPLRQLLAMHPQMIQLNRWAVANPNAIATIECQSQTIVVMADNIRIALSPKYLNNLPANLKTALHHEKDC